MRDNNVEIQFSDGTFFVVRTHYADTAKALARKLVHSSKSGDNTVAPIVVGCAVFNGEKLKASFGKFDLSLNG